MVELEWPRQLGELTFDRQITTKEAIYICQSGHEQPRSRRFANNARKKGSESRCKECHAKKWPDRVGMLSFVREKSPGSSSGWYRCDCGKEVVRTRASMVSTTKRLGAQSACFECKKAERSKKIAPVFKSKKS